MSTTPNLLIPYIASAQNNKETTANTAFADLDSALTDLLAITMTTADYTMSTAAGGEALGHLAYKLTGSIGAARNLIVPASKKLYIVSNQTTGGYAVTVKTPSGTGVALSDAAYHVLYCDGTNVVAVYATAGFDVPAIVQGVGTNGQVLAYIAPARAVKFPASAAGSTAVAKTAPTATTTYTFKKNGTSFATCVFDPTVSSGLLGVWTQASDATFNGTSDVLEIDGPATADVTLANVGMVLQGQRL